VKPLNLSTQQFLILALSCAIILRLLLMPFFAHVDLFSEYRRIFYVIENNLFFANSHRIVTYYIEMAFAGLATLFIPSSETLFYLANPTKSTSSLQDYYMFLEDPYIYRYLFFAKLPYFLFDLATAAVIWQFSDNERYRRLALLLWLFNPLTLYATYVFGRFEVIGLFFLALTTFQLKRERLLLASFCFALALHCREINLLFAPFFFIALIDFKGPWLQNIITITISTIIVGLMYITPDWLVSKLGYVDFFMDPVSVEHHSAVKKLFSLGYYWFFPIVFGLAATVIYAWEIGTRSHAERFILSCALCLLIYFAFNVHSVHYASWLVLFPILSVHYGKNVVLPTIFIVAVWIVLWLFKTDAGVFTPFMAAPLSAEFIGIGHFPTYFNNNFATQDLNLHSIVQILRTVFAAAMAFMCFRLVKN